MKERNDNRQIVIAPNGTKLWYRDDKLHREDGPAVIRPDGTQYWYRDGKHHRDGGPAVARADGTRLWFRDGLRHRLDGPAIIFPDGEQQWWFEGEWVTKSVLTKVSPKVISVFGPMNSESYRDFSGARDGLLITFPTEEDAMLWYLREK